jgi:hypothetical protein
MAIKIQYPGVGESISSDLKLIKPLALRLIDIDGRDLEIYMRGSKHFIYVNRTNFGLYNILHELKARVRTDTFPPKSLQGWKR